MRRSYLEHKFYKHWTKELSQAFKKQKNYCNRLYKRERRKFYSNLNLNDITDNKMFWNVTKPLFSNKGGGKDNIVLVDGDKIISDDSEVAQTFNDFFKNTLTSLDIVENKFLLTETNNESSGVNEAIEKYKYHPSVISIKENVAVEHTFSFSEVNANDIRLEVNRLNKNKSGTFMDIPAKHLKQVA